MPKTQRLKSNNIPHKKLTPLHNMDDIRINKKDLKIKNNEVVIIDKAREK